MMIVMPAIIMLIFGFALGGQVKNTPVLVDNQDAGYAVSAGSNVASLHFGNAILASLKTDDRVKVTVGDFASGKKGVGDGTYFAAVNIPANFSETLAMKKQGQNLNATILIYIDSTQPTTEASVMGAIQSALQSSLGSGGVVFNEQFAFGGTQFSGLDVSIPAVIAFVLTFLVLLISLIIVSRETTSGTLPRLYTTPLSALERLLGYAVALLLLGILMVGVILAIGVGVFGAVVEGSFYLLFGAAVLYAVAHVFLAIFLSNFAKNELQAVQLAPLIALPSMALSGMLIPVSSFPGWVQSVARFVPMYYGVKIFEGIMLKGYGIANLSLEFAIVGVMALLFLGLASLTVKDKITA
jgi:ABC-2 type transport system permease protein